LKKTIIFILVIVPWLSSIVFPTKVESSSYQQEATITFIDNPNLPRAPAPGIAPGENPILMVNEERRLPKTNDSNSSLIPLGVSLIFTSITIFYLATIKQRCTRQSEN
jgi:hypothetical protein